MGDRRQHAVNTPCLPQNFAETLVPVYSGYYGCLGRTMQNIGGKGGGEVNRVYYKQCENGKF